MSLALSNVMRSKHLFLPIVISMCSVVTAPAQRKPLQTKGDVRVSKQHPTVYVTFEKYGKAISPWEEGSNSTGEPLKSTESGDDIWLRLHNNTHWAIELTTREFYMGSRTVMHRTANGSNVPGLGEGMEINAVYEVAEATGSVVSVRESDVGTFFTSILPPGRSVLFSVRHEYLSGGRKIYINFRYEWEQGNHVGREPTHRIEVSGLDIPKRTVLQKSPYRRSAYVPADD